MVERSKGQVTSAAALTWDSDYAKAAHRQTITECLQNPTGEADAVFTAAHDDSLWSASGKGWGIGGISVIGGRASTVLGG